MTDEYEKLEIIVEQENAHKYSQTYDFPESLCYFVKNSAFDIKILRPKVVEAVIVEKQKTLLENHSD
jgi:hypothetical protein